MIMRTKYCTEAKPILTEVIDKKQKGCKNNNE